MRLAHLLSACGEEESSHPCTSHFLDDFRRPRLAGFRCRDLPTSLGVVRFAEKLRLYFRPIPPAVLRTEQALPFVVGLHAETAPPLRNGLQSEAPPKADCRSRFAAQGWSEVPIDDWPVAAPALLSPKRPRDASVGQSADDDVAAIAALGNSAEPEPGRRVRAEVEVWRWSGRMLPV